MFNLQEGSEPVYRRVAESIKQAIRGGLYRPGDQLPTVRTVATQLVLNPNTVARAYRLLEQDGVIETVVGRGSFVAAQTDDAARLQAAIVDGLTRLYRAGWTIPELETWCLRTIRALAGGGSSA